MSEYQYFQVKQEVKTYSRQGGEYKILQVNQIIRVAPPLTYTNTNQYRVHDIIGKTHLGYIMLDELLKTSVLLNHTLVNTLFD